MCVRACVCVCVSSNRDQTKSPANKHRTKQTIVRHLMHHIEQTCSNNKSGNVILVFFCVVVVYSQFLVMFMFVFWSSNDQTKSPANEQREQNRQSHDIYLTVR